jgi:hypothetical protein
MKVAINTTSAPMQKFAVSVNPKKNTEIMEAQMSDTANYHDLVLHGISYTFNFSSNALVCVFESSPRLYVI